MKKFDIRPLRSTLKQTPKRPLRNGEALGSRYFGGLLWGRFTAIASEQFLPRRLIRLRFNTPPLFKKVTRLDRVAILVQS